MQWFLKILLTLAVVLAPCSLLHSALAADGNGAQLVVSTSSDEPSSVECHHLAEASDAGQECNNDCTDWARAGYADESIAFVDTQKVSFELPAYLASKMAIDEAVLGVPPPTGRFALWRNPPLMAGQAQYAATARLRI